MGSIFCAYYAAEKLLDDIKQCIAIKKLPEDVLSHPSEDVRRYVAVTLH